MRYVVYVRLYFVNDVRTASVRYSDGKQENYSHRFPYDVEEYISRHMGAVEFSLYMRRGWVVLLR